MALAVEQEIEATLQRLGAPADGPLYTAAVAAYEQARIDGLCREGALEIALGVLTGAGSTPPEQD